MQDPSLGKRVIRITGTIPAVNYIKLPTGKSVQTPGRFCYMQVNHVIQLERGNVFPESKDQGLDKEQQQTPQQQTQQQQEFYTMSQCNPVQGLIRRPLS